MSQKVRFLLPVSLANSKRLFYTGVDMNVLDAVSRDFSCLFKQPTSIINPHQNSTTSKDRKRDRLQEHIDQQEKEKLSELSEDVTMVIKEIRKQERQYNQTVARKFPKDAPLHDSKIKKFDGQPQIEHLHETSDNNLQPLQKCSKILSLEQNEQSNLGKDGKDDDDGFTGIAPSAASTTVSALISKKARRIVYPSRSSVAVEKPTIAKISNSNAKKESTNQSPKIADGRITTLMKQVSYPQTSFFSDLKNFKVAGSSFGPKIESAADGKNPGEKEDLDLLGNPTDKDKENLFKHLLTPTSTVASPAETPTVILTEATGGNFSGDGSGGNQQQDAKNGGKSWSTVKYSFGVLGATCATLMGGIVYVLGKPALDEQGLAVEDAYSELPLWSQYLQRCWHELQTYHRLIREPSREKLLPDVLSAPYYQPPYTLILEFTDMLVHPEWTYETGWRFKKRPGLDQFLEALYTRFEVVVYTAQMGMTVFPILESLDPNNLISYKLVRDATNFVDGDHVKDLDRINRDLRKVVVVDWNPNSVKLHESNLFQIPRWSGNNDDTTLYDLAAFLLAISEWEVDDVRTVLEYYSQFANPLAKFKEAQMQVLQSSQFS